MSKLEKQRVAIIACQVLQDLLGELLPPDLAADVVLLDYGLHEVPARLASQLQETIDQIEDPSLIVLGYGLCGNGLRGIRSGIHTLLVPRADDCIALLLGSRRAYAREFQSVPGTYYLSKGWLEAGSHPLGEYEEYVPRYGPEQAMWIMDQQYQHYERLALVAHSQPDLEKYRRQARPVARFCERWGMRYEEILGSDTYIRRLVELALAPEDFDGDFLVIPPGAEIRQEQFIR